MCLVLSLGRVGLLTGETERKRERKGINPDAERKKLVPIWPLDYEKRDNSGGDRFNNSEAEMALFSGQVRYHFCRHQISALT